MNRWGLRGRAMVLGMLPALLIALLLGAYFNYNRIHDAEQELRERGAAQARYLASAAEYGVVTLNPDLLHSLLKAARGEADVAFVTILDARFNVLAAQGTPPAGLPSRAAVAKTDDMLIFTAPIESTPLALNDLFTLGKADVNTDPPRIGWVRLGLSLQHLLAIKQTMLITGAGISLLVLLFGVALALSLSETVINPIQEMLMVVRELGAGGLHARVHRDASGELGDLQEGINQMAEALRASQRGLQLRIHEATAALAEQKEAAERANVAKSRFLAVASHDLRQPMHALGLFLGALREKLREPEQLRILGNIEASVAAMESLFNALLDISRLDAGVLEARAQVFPANRLLERIRAEFTRQAEAKRLKLLVVASRAVLHTDPLLLQRILFNLVSNALRYTDRGGVVVGCRQRGERVLIEVWDSGCGIPLEKQRDIFQEFVQLHNPEHDRSKGLGLGLAIVERLARLLDCPLTLRSRPGRGAVFGVSVVRAQPGALPQDQREQGRRTLSGQLCGLAVVVDDDEEILAAMVALLSAWGLQVVSAVSGAAALAQLSSAPDVLLCDYRLAGGESGLDVVKAFCATFRQAIPLVLITGDTAPETVREIKASGYPLLYKPVRPAKLRVLLSKMLAHA